MFIAEFSIGLKDTGEEEINEKYTHFAATTRFHERQNKTCRLNGRTIITFLIVRHTVIKMLELFFRKYADYWDFASMYK